ncbi:hypothetical protein AB434_0028 [Heyndrickxia coagulans]|uniref:Uncharacterized protein n=1 Tax=Heyndrickxia coagulans TaxID=1398 RepID=A0AAN0T4J2_HEYCO|nr:hypothetical protein SB48_HM08orf01780 [Heyndrickxia coagulans]AKN52433.1 hypothetical protein AB434_0028 [Heyndrickxia coagulans]KYC65649.1 hypothetical protein B4100_2422 [Heyndrickxia coagulans]KYC79305.1 hypothetical protein B4096_2340 [Heyndrickxia coagulans]
MGPYCWKGLVVFVSGYFYHLPAVEFGRMFQAGPTLASAFCRPFSGRYGVLLSK